MSLTRKHFQSIADKIAFAFTRADGEEQEKGVLLALDCLLPFLKRSNQRFDGFRFNDRIREGLSESKVKSFNST